MLSNTRACRYLLHDPTTEEQETITNFTILLTIYLYNSWEIGLPVQSFKN